MESLMRTSSAQAHPWFEGVDWENIHKYPAPYTPGLRTPDDTQHFDSDISDVCYTIFLFDFSMLFSQSNQSMMAHQRRQGILCLSLTFTIWILWTSEWHSRSLVIPL